MRVKGWYIGTTGVNHITLLVSHIQVLGWTSNKSVYLLFMYIFAFTCSFHRYSLRTRFQALEKSLSSKKLLRHTDKETVLTCLYSFSPEFHIHHHSVTQVQKRTFHFSSKSVQLVFFHIVDDATISLTKAKIQKCT